MSSNLLAGLANSVWSAIIALAVVPFFLKYLGIEAYGLIGFFITTQALLSLLDLGLAPTINREVARFSASGNLKEAGKLLHNLAIVYWCMAAVIVLLMFTASPFIVEHWLQSKRLPSETILHAVILMGVVVACRWPIGLYQGALFGAQRITLFSGINILLTTIGNLGAVAVLAFIAPTIEAFFIWQACVAIFYVLIIRWTAWRVVGRERIEKFEFSELKRIWRFSAGMSGVAVSAIILLQLDKVLLSRMLSLKDFGHYTLAGVVANGIYLLLTPLFNVIYPRLSAFVATGKRDELIYFYKTGTGLFLSLLFPIAIMAAVFSKDLLYLWTGNQSLSTSSAPVVSLFLIGTMLNGVMHFPYALQLAYGATRLPLIINLILIAIMAPLTIILAKSYGAVGGAASWALLNSIYVLLGTWLTHRSLLREIGITWLLADVVLPLSIAIMVAGFGGGFTQQSGLPEYMKLLIAVGLVCVTFVLTVLISPNLRVTVSNFIQLRRVRANVCSKFFYKN